MVVEQTTNIADASGHALGWGLIVSIGLALWSVTLLIQSIFSALNVAYEEPERRSVFRFYISTFLFALAGIVGGVVTLMAIVYVPIVFAFAGYKTDYSSFIGVVRWPVLALMVLFLLACLYRYGPSRRSAQWSWVTPGSLFATVVWLVASAGFSIYVANFANYDKFYGSLGAVIVLMFWLYITFYIVLLGAEINAELELQTAEDTTVGESRPVGKRGAFVADHVAGGPEGHQRPVSSVTADPAVAKRGKASRSRPAKRG
jgi:membrane protein